jgi:hypothetical protein
MPNAPHALDLLIGGYQLSATFNLASGLPFSLSYNSCADDIPGSAPCYANVVPGGVLRTHLTPYSGGKRTFYPAHQIGDGLFTDPGLGHIGNVERNSYWGPKFYNADMGLSKNFNIWESVSMKFRMDAFNVFNHINPGNPSGNVQNTGTITGEAPGPGPRQLEFSLRAQF